MTFEEYKMLGLDPKGPDSGSGNKQPRKLLIALILLLLVLGVLLVRNSDLWFGSDDAAEPEAPTSETTAKTDSASAPAKTSQPKSAPAQAQASNPAPAPAAKNQNTAKNQSAAKNHPGPAPAAPAKEATAKPTAPPVVATNRVILPPLDVEVVAGDTHRKVHPGSNATIAEIPGASSRSSKVTATVVPPSTNAAERELLPRATAPELRQSFDATYPLLGQHSRVQGSVVLEAVVGADGVIQNLRVVSGPAVLSTAAQQAVRDWRFKPYLEHGQPVETKARITVNFTIRVSDNPTKTS